MLVKVMKTNLKIKIGLRRTLEGCKSFISNELGQDVIEYSLLMVLIGAAAILVLSSMGTSIVSIFDKVKTALDTANDAAPSTGGTAP